MGFKTHRTTLNVKHSFGQVALVVAAFLFISGFIFPFSILWPLAVLTLIASLIHTAFCKVINGQQIRVLSTGASNRAHRNGGVQRHLR
jgi:hypothetical protein